MKKSFHHQNQLLMDKNESTLNKMTLNDNITNGTEETNENSGAGDSTAVHVNGESEKPMVEIDNEDKPAEESVSATEKSDQVEPTVPSTEPEPVSSTPVDTVNEGSSTAVDTAPPPAVEPPSTTTMEVNDNVPEAPVATESETAEVKSKSPRGKAKAPVVTTTTPPTRQSARGRKPASSSNAEENQPTDETVATNQNESPSSSQRAKRQAATIAKDAIAASNQANSTDDINDQDMVPSDDNDDPDHKASPSTGRKRAAPKSTPNAAKKAKGKNSVSSTSDVDDEAAGNEGEIVQTPPKKARTSANKKTPEPPSEEYVRKLRPRK